MNERKEGKLQFDAVAEEEIREIFPEIPQKKKIYAYDIKTMTGIRIALAVFYPSSLRDGMAIMYHFSINFDLVGSTTWREFFSLCFDLLRQEQFTSVYYKVIGSVEELSVCYDLMVDVDFEPKVYLGELLNYRLQDLLATDFMQGFADSKAAKLPLVALDQKLEKEDRMLLNKCAAQDAILQNLGYTREFSYLVREDDENAGVCCMNLAEDGLLLTSFHIMASDKVNRFELLKGLLGSIIQRAAAESLAPDTPLMFFFAEKFDSFEAERMFENLSDTANFQEFVHEL